MEEEAGISLSPRRNLRSLSEALKKPGDVDLLQLGEELWVTSLL